MLLHHQKSTHLIEIIIHLLAIVLTLFASLLSVFSAEDFIGRLFF